MRPPQAGVIRTPAVLQDTGGLGTERAEKDREVLVMHMKTVTRESPLQDNGADARKAVLDLARKSRAPQGQLLARCVLFELPRRPGRAAIATAPKQANAPVRL